MPNPFSALTSKIFGGVAVLAFAMLAIQTWRLSAAHDEIEARRNALATEQARHAVTIASLDALAGEMEQMVRDGELRKERLTAALGEAREAADDLREQAGDVRAAPVRDCVTPNVIRRSGL